MSEYRAVRTHPKVTVVIPVYNTRGIWLLESVASVEALQLTWSEIIVVDDGSSNVETLSALDELERRGVRVLRGDNAGVSAARNRGIEAARGDYILPLDADDLIGAKFLPEAVDVLDVRPEVTVFAGVLQSFGARTSQIVPPSEVSLAQLLLQNQVSVTSLFRKDAWQAVGGYDQNLRAGHEDLEFWVRLIVNGGRIVSSPTIAVHYRTGHESLTSVRAKTAGTATAEAIIANNPGSLADLLRASFVSADLIRSEAAESRRYRDLGLRYGALDQALGKIPGARRLLAELNQVAARTQTKRQGREAG